MARAPRLDRERSLLVKPQCCKLAKNRTCHLYSYGPYSCGLYSFCPYSYGLYSFCLYSYGLYSYGSPKIVPVIYIVMAHVVMAHVAMAYIVMAYIARQKPYLSSI